MKKKKIRKTVNSVFYTTISLLNCSFKNQNNLFDFKIVNNIFNSLTYIYDDFKNCSIKKIFKLVDDDGLDCFLFKTYSFDNKYTGYFVLDKNYELLVAHADNIDYYEDINDNFYIHNALSIDDKKYDKVKYKCQQKNSNDIKVYSDLKNYTVPYVDTSVYKTYSSAYGSSLKIEGVPTYYNDEEYRPYPSGGCGPTAGAMFLSFYDRHCSYYSNLYNPDLPLTQDEDNYRVQNIIKEIGTYMGTDSLTGGSSIYGISTGLTNYLNIKGYSNFTISNFSTYNSNGVGDTELIQELCSSVISSRNIACLTIKTDSVDEDVKYNHEVVLTGYDNYRYVGPTARVNYGWKERASDYTISFKYIAYIQCLRSYL